MTPEKDPNTTSIESNKPNYTPQTGIYSQSSPYDEIECEEIILKLESLLDGELDNKTQQEVQKMINECGYCLEQYQIEKSMRDLVKMGFQNFNVADTLISKIKSVIRYNRNA